MTTYRCVKGHDRCGQMYSGPECPTCERGPGIGAPVISEHERLEACLSDLARKGRPVGAKTKPMPPKEGPLWQAFVAWFGSAPVRSHIRADLWRAFCAGAQSTERHNQSSPHKL